MIPETKTMENCSLLLITLCCLLALIPSQSHGLSKADGHGSSKVEPIIKSRRSLTNIGGGGPLGAMEADKITALPGQPAGVTFDQYAGYVKVAEGRALFYYFVEATNHNASQKPLLLWLNGGVTFDQYAGYIKVAEGRALFYYFVEATSHNASQKPLLLWLNGGPGCSSLGWGAFTASGPFRPNPDGKTLSLNPHSWNNAANVIYLEMPAGVGFSYANNTSDYSKAGVGFSYANNTSDYSNSGDISSACDAYEFLNGWLDRFPQYMTRDFFVAGESYAGHFVPQLAEQIVNNNKIAKQTAINLKGIAVGNAVLDSVIEYKSYYDYLWNHAIISDEIYEDIQLNCKSVSWGNPSNYTQECYDVIKPVLGLFDGIDVYNIFAPMSPDLACDTRTKQNGLTQLPYELDPCIMDYLTVYLNLPEVQKALHATVAGSSGPWADCSSNITKTTFKDSQPNMAPTIKNLIASGVSVWIYSGDADSVCPVTGTVEFIKMLNLGIEEPWRGWYMDRKDGGFLGGYVTVYKGLTFAMVREAGHVVPRDQPERALTLITSFLQREILPYSPFFKHIP